MSGGGFGLMSGGGTGFTSGGGVSMGSGGFGNGVVGPVPGIFCVSDMRPESATVVPSDTRCDGKGRARVGCGQRGEELKM